MGYIHAHTHLDTLTLTHVLRRWCGLSWLMCWLFDGVFAGFSRVWRGRLQPQQSEHEHHSTVSDSLEVKWQLLVVAVSN